MSHNNPRKTEQVAALLVCLSLLAGCGSPFAGGWQGTMDVGPVLAHSVTIEMPPEGYEGDLTVQTSEGDKTYRICKATLTVDQFELSFDRLNADCVAEKGANTDVHTLGLTSPDLRPTPTQRRPQITRRLVRRHRHRQRHRRRP